MAAARKDLVADVVTAVVIMAADVTMDVGFPLGTAPVDAIFSGSSFLCAAAEITDMAITAVDAEMELLYENDDYRRMLVQTLADRLAEACAEKLHECVRKSLWGYAEDEDFTPAELLACKYTGIRPAVGYPCLPDISLNFILDELLDFSRIGIGLTENGMMRPHASVSGFVISHPKSRYFSVGAIDDEQLRDYSARRGVKPEEMKRFLASILR